MTEKGSKQLAKRMEVLRKKQEEANRKELGGFYKSKEVAIIVDKSFDENELGPLLSRGFFCKPDAGSENDIEVEEDTRQFHLFHENMLPGLCLWTHRLYSRGGFCTIGKAGSRVLPFIVMVMSGAHFVELACTAQSGDVEYPGLTKFIQQCRKEFGFLHARFGEVGEIVTCSVVVNDLDRGVVGRQLARAGTHVPLNVDDCIAYLIHELQVNVIRTKRWDEAVEYLQNASRVVADSLYRAPKSDLDCVKRLPLRLPENAVAGGNDELQRIWINMLQMIPGVSPTRATRLAAKYSCPHALAQTALNPLLPLLELQLQYQFDFGDNKETAGKRKVSGQKKLSRLLYKLLTSSNKDELLEEDI